MMLLGCWPTLFLGPHQHAVMRRATYYQGARASNGNRLLVLPDSIVYIAGDHRPEPGEANAEKYWIRQPLLIE